MDGRKSWILITESKMTRTFVTFLLVLGICQASFMLKNIDEKEVDLKYRLPSDVVIPTDYTLHLTPDLKNFTFEGEVNITLRALTTNNTLTLNSKELTIHNVKFEDLDTNKTFKNEYTEDKQHEILIITVDPQFEKDHNYSLQIQYSGILNNNSRGFYRSRVMDGDRVTYAATTYFESTNARLAFPCWDEPAYKAKFNIRLTHNKEFQAISNMDELDTQDKQDDMITTSFKETPPMSTYLVAFVVSEYKFKEDKDHNFTYRVWTKANAIDQTDYALKMGMKILEQLDLYTNISYQTFMPEKIDQVTQKDFLIGGMENWGLVIYREDRLLYDEVLSTTRTKMNVLKIIAHEFTHQWFGDLVSPKWWKYIWLNEGFATYFEYFIAHKVVPDLRLNDMFVVESMQQTAMVADWSPKQRPMNQDVTSPQEISALYDNIAYQKAASVIRMMSHAMTEEVFQKGLQQYLKSTALGNADSNDLFGFLQKALDESRIKWRQPVQVIMHNWMEYPGYPTLTVKRVDGGYQVTQEQFVTVLMEIDKYRTKWWIPITCVEESTPDFSNTIPDDWLAPEEESHIVPSDIKEGWFIFNTQQTGYYRVNYDVENWELLIKELNMGNDTKIHVLNRAQMIDDAFNLARVNSLNYTVALNVALYLTHEADYMPWQPAFRHLSFLRNLLRTSEKYHTFMRFVAYLTRALTEVVGYEPKENESDLDKMLRINTMKWACEAGVEKCTSYAEKIYQEWLENPEMKLDVNLKNEILCAGVRSANESAWSDTRVHITESVHDANDKKNQLMVLACSNSSEILTKYLKLTLDSDYPIDFKTAAIDVVSRYPAGPQLVFDFLLKEYKRITKIPNFKNAIGEVVIAIAGGITTQQQNFDLTAFLVEEKLAESLEAVMRQTTMNIMWTNQYKSTVDEWLDSKSDLFENPENENNSASSMAVASFLVIFSLFISRFY